MKDVKEELRKEAKKFEELYIGKPVLFIVRPTYQPQQKSLVGIIRRVEKADEPAFFLIVFEDAFTKEERYISIGHPDKIHILDLLYNSNNKLPDFLSKK